MFRQNNTFAILTTSCLKAVLSRMTTNYTYQSQLINKQHISKHCGFMFLSLFSKHKI